MTETNNVPRTATAEERQALARHLMEEMHYMPEEDEYREAELSTARAAICVFDDYVIDRSGSTGKVLLAMWPESVSFFRAYVMKNGVIESIAQDYEFRVEE